MVRIGEISRQVRGVSYDKAESSKSAANGLIPILRANNIADGEINLDDLVYVPSYRVKANQYLVAGDVLIAASSGSLDVVGKAAPIRYDLSAGFGAFCKVLRPNDRVWPPYFAHYFQTPQYRKLISGLAAGANINNLKNEHLDNLEIPLPPLPEQQRIAAILDAAEALRAKRRAALGKLDALGRAVFLEMFGEPVGNPRGWETVPLGNIVEFIGGGTPSREVDEYYRGNICWATSKDMKGQFLYDTQEHITQEAVERSATNLVPVGTILICVKSKILLRRLPVMITCIPTCFGQDLKGIKLRNDLPAVYLATHLRIGQSALLQLARGVNTEGLTLDHLRSYRLMIPPISLVRRYADFEVRHRSMRDTLERSSISYQKLFASLQQRAFRGEL